MTGPTYDGKLVLAERFRALSRDGRSPAAAVQLLAELYYAFHFHIVQPLSGALLFWLGADDELIVEMEGRRLDPEKILTREPHGLDPPAVPLDQYRWMIIDPRQAERDALAELAIGAPSVPPPQETEPAKLPPQWIQIVDAHISSEIERNGRFPTLGSARDTVIGLLRDRKKAIPNDRTIERGIHKHRPSWIDK
ncbi:MULTISPECIES: hypothetical protein [unclassified Bradyrhizobium]|uniref:hypothetical protein n=1 Tax=unclassified Bradyrhizobium TaxID=2631580 RepID=UPI00339549CD